jgi:hypothetical protein
LALASASASAQVLVPGSEPVSGRASATDSRLAFRSGSVSEWGQVLEWGQGFVRPKAKLKVTPSAG